MANETTTSSVTAEELVEQAQTYASTWASVGGPFDDGNTLARAEEEKAKFWSLVEQLVQERDDYRTAEEHQIALRQKDQARVDFLHGHTAIQKEQYEALVSAKLEALPADLKNRYLVVKMSGDIDKETAHKLRLEFEKHSNGAAVFVNMQVDIEAIDLSNRDAVKKAEGMKKAAMLIEQKAEAYDAEHGSTDRSTGTREYPGDGAEHYNELMELADDLRRQAEGSETQ